MFEAGVRTELHFLDAPSGCEDGIGADLTASESDPDSVRKSHVATVPSEAALTIIGSVLEPTSKSETGDLWYLRIKRGERRTRASQRAIDLSVEAETIVFGPQ